MPYHLHRHLTLAIATGSVVTFASPSHAAPFTQGNILLSTNNSIREYTTSGTFIQSIAVPEAVGGLRDLIWHPSGQVHGWAGTHASPLMATYDPATNTWTTQTTSGWSMGGNTTYGGIDTDGRYVYAADGVTSVSPNTSGVIRFDRLGGAPIRSNEQRDVHDVVKGLDGLIYSLNDSGSPSGRSISAYQPETLTHLRDISIGHLSFANRGIAVDTDGSIFVVTLDGDLIHTDRNGDEIKRLDLKNLPNPVGQHFDVDIRADGTILVGSTGANAHLTDRNFSYLSQIDSINYQAWGNMGAFVDFTPVPEPSTLTLFGLAGAGLLARRRRGA